MNAERFSEIPFALRNAAAALALAAKIESQLKEIGRCTDLGLSWRPNH